MKERIKSRWYRNTGLSVISIYSDMVIIVIINQHSFNKIFYVIYFGN